MSKTIQPSERREPDSYSVVSSYMSRLDLMKARFNEAASPLQRRLIAKQCVRTHSALINYVMTLGERTTKRGAPRLAFTRHLEIAHLALSLQERNPELKGGNLYQAVLNTDFVKRENIGYDTVAAAVRKNINILREAKKNVEGDEAQTRAQAEIEFEDAKMRWKAMSDALSPAFSSCGPRRVCAGIRK
jgi:hypothetical protein